MEVNGNIEFVINLKTAKKTGPDNSTRGVVSGGSNYPVSSSRLPNSVNHIGMKICSSSIPAKTVFWYQGWEPHGAAMSNLFSAPFMKGAIIEDKKIATSLMRWLVAYFYLIVIYGQKLQPNLDTFFVSIDVVSGASTCWTITGGDCERSGHSLQTVTLLELLQTRLW